VTYLLPLAIAISTVNSWTLCRVTDPLQDGRLSCICSSYDENSELDLWNSTAGLFGCWMDARATARAGQFVTHLFGSMGLVVSVGTTAQEGCRYLVHTRLAGPPDPATTDIIIKQISSTHDDDDE